MPFFQDLMRAVVGSQTVRRAIYAALVHVAVAALSFVCFGIAI